MDTTHPTGGRLAELEQLAAAADVLVGGSFDGLLTSDSPAVVAALARVEGRVAAYKAGFARRVRELEALGQSAPPTDVLTHGGLMSGRDAQQALRVADTLESFPELTPLLVDGSIGPSHVDALAGVVKDMSPEDRSAWQADPDKLVDAAQGSSPEEFGRSLKRRRTLEQAQAGVSRAEREHRANSARSWTKDGRWHLHVDGDAETGCRMETAIQTEMDAMRASGELDALHPDGRGDVDHLRFYAVQRVLSRGFQVAGPNRTNGQVAEVGVFIDADTLMRGPHERTVCELSTGEPIEIAAARRLACDAGIYPVVLSGDSVVLDQGRKIRVANREQRRALRAMHRTCMIDGCQVPFDRCEIHHVDPWNPHGQTDVANMGPLCCGHHHLVHDHGWMLTIDAQRIVRLYRPDGTLYSTSPPPGLAPPRHNPGEQPAA